MEEGAWERWASAIRRAWRGQRGLVESPRRQVERGRECPWRTRSLNAPHYHATWANVQGIPRPLQPPPLGSPLELSEAALGGSCRSARAMLHQGHLVKILAELVKNNLWRPPALALRTALHGGLSRINE